MMWWYGADGWSWFWMASMMVVFWGVVAFLVVWAVRALAGPHPTGDAAIDVLRRRFAAGEISAEEFASRKKALGA
jgi:putative membrane protein